MSRISIMSYLKKHKRDLRGGMVGFCDEGLFGSNYGKCCMFAQETTSSHGHSYEQPLAICEHTLDSSIHMRLSTLCANAPQKHRGNARLCATMWTHLSQHHRHNGSRTVCTTWSIDTTTIEQGITCSQQ